MHHDTRGLRSPNAYGMGTRIEFCLQRLFGSASLAKNNTFLATTKVAI
jgi:hypothetical protein